MREMCRDCTCCTAGSCTRSGQWAGYCRATCPCEPLDDLYDDEDYLDEF